MKRRTFIRQGASAATLALLTPYTRAFGGDLAFAGPGGAPGQRDLLVVMFLRGGCDGLSLVAPSDDKNYLAARAADLLVKDSGEKAGLMLKNSLAGVDFRLHPSAAGLHELYAHDALAVVHAAGLPNGTRSHFEAQDLLERGVVQNKNSSGWLTRYLAAAGTTEPLAAVSVAPSVAGSLLGSPHAVSLQNINDFRPPFDEAGLRTLRQLYGPASTATGLAPAAGLRTLAAFDRLQARLPRDADGNYRPYAAEHGAVYPGDGEYDNLSRNLQTLAQLIKLDVGLQVATLDYDGWDMHDGQAWRFPGQAEGLSRALAAFYNDVSRYHARLTVVVMSEFGRRLRSNENGGTDHGYGSVMLVLGGHVRGGRMYGTWKGLATEQLDQGADLDVTTDYRTVLSEIVTQRLLVPNPALVFPGFTQAQPLGLVVPNKAR